MNKSYLCRLLKLASTRTLYEKKLRRLQVSDGHEPHRGGEKDGLYSGSENEEQSKADGAAVSGVLRICSNHVFGDVFSVVVVQPVALCTDLNEEQQAAKETRKIQKDRSQVRTQSTTCISRFYFYFC